MKRIEAKYLKEDEIAVGNDQDRGHLHNPLINLENTYKESCITDIYIAFRTLQGDKGHPKAKEVDECFLILDEKDDNVVKISNSKLTNNDIVVRYYDLLKDHNIRTFLLLPGEKKELELFLDEKKVKYSFLLDITVTCTFEDKHVEKFDMYICVM